MMTYVTAFIFYTLAMVGILLIGFVVYKKVFENTKGENNGLIKVLDSSPIGHKKMLLVVQVRNERFLIASGVEHTTFLSKLSNDSFPQKVVKKEVMKEEKPKDFSSEIYKEANLQEQFKQRQELVAENMKKAKAQELQRRFRELYEKDTPKQQILSTVSGRKKAIKQLLESLNFDENLNSKSGSKF